MSQCGLGKCLQSFLLMSKACVGETDLAVVEISPWLTDGGDFTACYLGFEKGG